MTDITSGTPAGGFDFSPNSVLDHIKKSDLGLAIGIMAILVVLIVPLTDATRGLIGAKEIALMKHGALLVNAARGPVVDTAALVEACCLLCLWGAVFSSSEL